MEGSEQNKKISYSTGDSDEESEIKSFDQPSQVCYDEEEKDETKSSQFGVYVRTPFEEKVLQEMEEELAHSKATHRFGYMDSQLIESIESYIEQMQMEASMKPDLQLAQQTSNDYKPTIGNKVSFSDSVFDPDEPRNIEMINRFKRHLGQD
ncbi:hypothetical protein RDWZM_001586 [Blomia tropicalis]|uniref:Uncharacterized protein n=1 Tax=Blomia tropicalis TaxID=40697 RepID=A0A9Q0RQS2_BLOTA|nr:hypothetical protein RDWZM_001586 [Blomia tropicalis]